MYGYGSAIYDIYGFHGSRFTVCLRILESRFTVSTDFRVTVYRVHGFQRHGLQSTDFRVTVYTESTDSRITIYRVTIYSVSTVFRGHGLRRCPRCPGSVSRHSRDHFPTSHRHTHTKAYFYSLPPTAPPRWPHGSLSTPPMKFPHSSIAHREGLKSL